MTVKRSKVRKIKNITLRTSIVVIAYYALSNELLKNGKYTEIIGNFTDLFSENSNNVYLFTVLLLMLVNWSIEAIKWKYLILKSERISFFRALKAVFTGICVGTFTPNRIGEFLGRSFMLDKTHPWKVFFMTIIGSYSQLLATIIFGAAGLIVFIYRYSGFSTGISYLDAAILFFSGATVFFVIFIYFRIDILHQHFSPWIRKRFIRFDSWFRVVAEYSFKELLIVLILSVARYFVFNFQFYLLLLFVDINISFCNALIFSSVIYLVITIIPTIALSEIGIRGSVAIYMFAFYFDKLAVEFNSVYSVAIASASSILWLVNIVIPAVLGTFFVYHLKFFRNNKIKSL